MLFIKKKAKEAEMEKMKAVEVEQPKPETVKCPKCGAELDKQRVVKAKYICYECGSYFRVKTKNRIKMVTDSKSFEPWFEDMPMSNPLNTAGYEDKVKAAQEKTGLKEAVTVGKALINGEPAMIGICDARFLMSSMGYVVGEKIARAVERATKASCIHVLLFRWCQNAGGYHFPDADGKNLRSIEETFRSRIVICIDPYRSYNRWCNSQLCNAWRYHLR